MMMMVRHGTLDEQTDPQEQQLAVTQIRTQAQGETQARLRILAQTAPEPEPEPQLPGQLSLSLVAPVPTPQQRALERGLCQLGAAELDLRRRAAAWLLSTANESAQNQQALRRSTALVDVSAELVALAPKLPLEERRARVRWRVGEARARIQHRERAEMRVHLLQDATVRVLQRERDEAERAMLEAEERVLPAQIEAERCAHEYGALERSTLSLGEQGAKLLRSTRALEDGETAVWQHHQQTVADMRQAVRAAEQRAAEAERELEIAEIGQREAIQACVLAERKEQQDKEAAIQAEERKYGATFTQERSDATEGLRLAIIEAEESKEAYDDSKATIVGKVCACVRACVFVCVRLTLCNSV